MRTLVQWFRLIRFPLMFTAVGDAWAVRWLDDEVSGAWALPPVGDLALLAAISFCLYGLGMVLNDVMDLRVDSAGEPDRPIPSGDVPRWAAVALACALGAGGIAAARSGGPDILAVASAAAILIVGYNCGLKRWPVLGVVLLGLIRATHCQLSGVGLAEGRFGPVLAGWVSVFLFTHVAIVSWIAHEWEGKRPAVKATGRWVLAFVIIAIDVVAVSFLQLTEVAPGPTTGPLRLVTPWLVAPLAAGLAYLLVMLGILASRRLAGPVERGRMAMRWGLIWLLVYDVAFLASAGRWAGVLATAALLVLLLVSSRLLIRLRRRVGLMSPGGAAQSSMESASSAGS